jgi:hypothetical protein
MTHDQIASSLCNQPADALWSLQLRHARTLAPFWEGCIRAFAERCSLPDDKRDKHLAAAGCAFDLMDGWRKGSKLVKARRKEIDSAISFIRNKAIERPVMHLRIAPMARNAAGVLRMLLHVAVRSYKDDDIAELIATSVFELAAVRVMFPFDTGTLVCFHPGHSVPAQSDPIIMMLERAGEETGKTAEVRALLAEAARTGAKVENPEPILLPVNIWSLEYDAGDALLHYMAIQQFHKRS